MRLAQLFPITALVGCSFGSPAEMPEANFDFQEALTGGEITFIPDNPEDSFSDYDAIPTDIPIIQLNDDCNAFPQFSKFEFFDEDMTPTELFLYPLEDSPINFITRDSTEELEVETRTWLVQMLGCELEVELSLSTYLDTEHCNGSSPSFDGKYTEFSLAAYLTGFEDQIENIECSTNEAFIKSLLKKKAKKYPELCIRLEFQSENLSQ